MPDQLIHQKCVPCEGGIAPLTPERYQPYLDQITGWNVVDEKQLVRDFNFADFAAALEFVNQVGEIAEQENHHPDILLHNWNKVRLVLTTHAIHGLSTNDFILAAKVDVLNRVVP